MRTLDVVGLGRMAYGEALALQRTLAHRKVAGEIPNDLLLLVEHPPVVTLGRGFKTEHLSTPREFLAARNVEVFEAERGGDITFHGPGQLVGYPIFDLTQHKPDLHWFLRQLEAALITVAADFGLVGERREGYTGVWTGGRKLASIGIHVKQWVTWHGFALNVMTDLRYFDLIVPCGIPDVTMTSLQKELGERTPRDVWARAIDQTVLAFADTFSLRPQMVSRDDLAVPA
ncbi:MAG: lipoyl(octanoyl) transferase LipB [Gemmatimonadales bacterium]